jgi:hypothetical protein
MVGWRDDDDGMDDPEVESDSSSKVTICSGSLSSLSNALGIRGEHRSPPPFFCSSIDWRFLIFDRLLWMLVVVLAIKYRATTKEFVFLPISLVVPAAAVLLARVPNELDRNWFDNNNNSNNTVAKNLRMSHHFQFVPRSERD